MGSNSHPAALYQLRIVTRILALVILLLVFVGFLLPTDYRVERSVVIDTPLNTVSEHMFQGSVLPQWMYIQGGQVDSFDGVLKVGDSIGLSYDESADSGELILVERTNHFVRFNVRPKPSINLVNNEITLIDKGSSTLVQWTIEGDLKAGLLGPYLAFFANDIAGKNFEISLQNLKSQIESQY